MRSWKCSIGLTLLLCSAASAQAPLLGSHGATVGKTATVTANLAVTGAAIPSTFVGISAEVGDLIAGYYQGNTGAALSYINLAKLLGPNGYLRIGGNSSDVATPPALTSGIASNLNTFVTSIGAGWKVIYGLDAVANNSATAATQAGLLATALGTANVVFQYGNEPIISGHFNNSTYATMWSAYNTAVQAAVTGALTAAPDDGLSGTGGTNNQTAMAGLPIANSAQTFITIHAYEVCNPTTFTNAMTIGNWATLSSRNAGPTPSWAAVTKMRITEQAAICNRGQTGLTDTVMAVAYYIEKAGYLAVAGWAGMDSHNVFQIQPDSTNGPLNQANYNQFVQQADLGFAPGAEFYGLYLFAQIEGQTVVASSVSGNGNVYAIATQRTAGKANILITNLDAASPVSVTPQQSTAWSAANVLQVKSATGVGCADKSLTLGGQAIGEGGSWSGSPFSISNGQSITLGPCEAALVSVQ